MIACTGLCYAITAFYLKHYVIFWTVRLSYITLGESVMCFTKTPRLVSCWYNSLKSITTTDSSDGALIRDMLSGGAAGGQRREDDFADISEEQLGMLVHPIW